MSYTINRLFESENFDDVVQRTRSALSDQGFGVMTEIDVKATLKKKIDQDIEPYLILGACNPSMASEAIKMEPRVGAMLPCNVVVRTTEDNVVEVAAIDPLASMQAIDNENLAIVASEVQGMLRKVVDNI